METSMTAAARGGFVVSAVFFHAFHMPGMFSFSDDFHIGETRVPF